MNKQFTYFHAALIAILAIVLLLFAQYLDNSQLLEPSEKKVQRNIEKHIGKEFARFLDQLEDIERDHPKFDDIDFRRFPEFKYSLFIFQQNQLIYWNENSLNLPLRIIQFDAGIHFMRLPGGYFLLKKSRSEQYANTDFIYLIPIKYIFPLQNQHLQNHFSKPLKIPAYFSIGDHGEKVINIEYGEEIVFSLSRDADVSTVPADIVFLLHGLFIALLIISLYFFAVLMAKKINPFAAFGFLTLTLFLSRFLMIQLDFPAVFSHLHLFNPALYASSVLHSSLGDLILNCLVVFLPIYFFYRYVPDQQINKKTGFALFLLTFSGALYILFWISRIFRSQVIDSSISLEIDNFFSLDVYSIISILIGNIILFGFILLGIKAYRYARIALENRHRLLVAGFVFSALVLLIGHFTFNLPVTIFLLVWTVLCLLVFYQFNKAGRKTDYLSDTLIIAGLLGLFSGFFYYHFTEEKTEDSIRFMARKLAVDRDPVTEFLFDDIEMRIAADPFVKNFFLNPHFPFRELADRIQSIYFSGYFNRYELRLFALNARGELIDGTSDLEKFGEEGLGITGEAQLTSNDYLFFIPRPDGTFAYIGNLPVLLQDKVIGSIIIELTPKVYRKNYLYPELLLEERKKPIEELQEYDYAVYINKKLITRQGRFPYNFFIEREIQLEPGEFMQAEFNQREHVIYLADENKLVVVSRIPPAITQPITFFSYLFCFNLLCIVLIRLSRFGFKNLLLLGKAKEFELSRLTFREKVQTSMLSVIVLSFIVIGFVTYFHFTREYNKSFQERLLEREEAVQASINYHLESDNLNLEPFRGFRFNPLLNMSSTIFELADIHAIDINIYGIDGKLMLTSQPGIFEKGLMSELMHPAAMSQLIFRNRSQFLQNEKIGELEFLSVYVPIRDGSGEVLGFLNLPYFEKEKNLNQEISGFFVALVNVYVLLLIAGGLVAFFIGNSITQSLSVIGEKLQKVKLGKQNEPIEWKSKDEIGELVAEYNKMIFELEKSAKLLAKSEREYAWREMAKQIAHEIKNPLTPMKLRIQHLQRAIREDHPNKEEMAQKVLNSLIEQIDTLSHIATEFSSFAKMPKAEFEPVNAIEIARSTIEIFKDNSTEVQIELEAEADEILVHADKQQLNRVFTNLIKNAVQAIPSEREGLVVVKIKEENNQGTCLISIKDNGTGIPEELRENVFVPNFTTKSSGMGLGLAMSKQIIENASGEIWFESDESKGTTFYFKLNLHEATEYKKGTEELHV